MFCRGEKEKAMGGTGNRNRRGKKWNRCKQSANKRMRVHFKMETSACEKNIPGGHYFDFDPSKDKYKGDEFVYWDHLRACNQKKRTQKYTSKHVEWDQCSLY